jgi:hypothetical protein
LNAPVITKPFFRSTEPATVGLNAILMSQLPPAGTPTLQLVLTLMKGSLTRMVVSGIATEPELLVRVTVCGRLISPTMTCPNLSGCLGLIRSFGCFASGDVATSGDDASSDCASAGSANALSRNNDRKARPTIDRVNDLIRICNNPPQATVDIPPCFAIRAFY